MKARATESANCLVQSVTTAFANEPGLEAVKINHADKSISVATLGRVNNQAIEAVLTRQIEEIQQNPPLCALLEGTADCADCVLTAPIDQRQITVTREDKSTTIARVTCPTAPRFWRWRDIPWPKLVPREIEIVEEDQDENEWKLQLAAAAVCGATGLAAHFAPAPWRLPLYGAAYLSGAWFTVHEVWEGLQKRILDVHFLMLSVAAGSAAVGAWSEGAMLLFLFSLSGALEHYAMGRTHREIRSLFKSAPKTAVCLEANGQEILRPVEQLKVGMRLLIKPGEQFPADAELIHGATAVDESNLTGEATPVEKAVGDTLLAGTINLWGAVEAMVLRRASQSALQRIIQLIRDAQHLKAPSQRFTDKFGTTYTYAILGLTLVMFFVWWLGFKLPPFISTEAVRSAFYRAMTLLVVASPCALVLSIPSAVLAAIAWSARRGILFRGGAAVERLAEIQVVAMDKTGTLTTGELQVEQIESFPPGSETRVAELAYSLERLSTHPLARAITRYGKQKGLSILGLTHVESVTGAGVRARLDAAAVSLGKRDWIEQEGALGMPAGAGPSEIGLSEVWVRTPGLTGRIVLRDNLRPQARDVVLQLHALGLQTLVLTGDRRSSAEHLQSQLSVDDVRSELKPEDKVQAIHALVQAGKRVAMIGDGVNDAPSLAAADVGVAMGARGSDAALEQAEIVLMHDRLENFLTAFTLSRRARAVIRQNLVISLGTVVVLVVCAVMGRIPLTVGVIGHEGSTVIVVMNSLRLLLIGAGKTAPARAANPAGA